MGLKYILKDKGKEERTIYENMITDKIDTSTEVCGLKLDNPIIPASGCFGFGYEMVRFYDINVLGSIALKGTTLKARFGNPLPRVAECPSGMINSVGLQNPGVDKVIAEELPKARAFYKKPMIANVSGFSIDEFVETSRKLSHAEGIGLIELNISCPNVHGGGMSFGTHAESAAEVTAAVKKEVTKPLIVKLTPNVTDITEIAKAVADAGADGLCLINTLLGMRIDLKTRKPTVANVMGGMSGPAIFPLALRMVWQVKHAVDIPIIGCGGISTPENVLEMMMAGASAVEVGAANLRNPYACKEIIEGLPAAMRKYGISSLQELKNK